MGRRKKRDNSKKRSLVFEESPAEKGHHPYSPVLCVDHPITAASVTVDDDCNVSWISPQFNGITASHGKRRQARRPPSHRKAAAGNRPGESLARGNLSTRTRHHDNARSCRFPALDFVGDHSRKGARKSRRSSPCQEVNVSAEDGLETSELRSKDRTQIQQSNRRPETNTHSSDGEIKTKRRRSHRSSVKIDGVNHDCNENSDETSGEKNNDEDKRRKDRIRRGRRDVLGVENLNWSENNDNNTRDGRESFVRDTKLGVDCEYGQVEKQRRQTVFGKSAERIPRPSLVPLTSFCENEAELRTTKQPHTLSAAPKTSTRNAHPQGGKRSSLDRMCRLQNNSFSEMQGTESDVQQRITEHNSSRLSHLSFAAERNSSQKRKKGKRRKSYHSDILVSPAEMEAWPASPNSLLQVRQDSLLGPLRVNLFAGSPSDVSIPGSAQNHNVSVASSAKNDDCGVRGVGTTNSKANVSDSCYNYEGLHSASEQEDPSQSSFTKLNDPRSQKLKRQKLAAKTKRQDFGNNKYQLSPRSSEGDLRRSLSEGHLRRSMSEGHLRRSKRLQDKRVEALRCLFPYTPPGASQKARPTVLVSDTPENAYHLSYRQKQQLGIY